MENVRNFVDLVALSDNIAAKEELDKILSQKSFDALDERKQQIAGAIFGTTEEPELDLDNAVAELEDEEVYAEDVEHDGEQLDEVSFETATKVYKARALGRQHGDTRNKHAETDVAQQERSKKIINSRFGKKGAAMTNKVDMHDSEGYVDTAHLSGSKRKENFAKK